MIGFKVSLNSKTLFTAAHQDAMYLSAGVSKILGSDNNFLGATVMYAVEDKEESPKVKEAFWEASKLHIGDEVSIIVVDIDNPSPATYHFDYGVKCLLDYETKEGTCFFCGANENENLLIFERSKGKICASCVKFYARLLEQIS
jgi:hypothetical protein